MTIELSYDFTPQEMPAMSATVPENTYFAKLVKIGEKREEINRFAELGKDDKRVVQDYFFSILPDEENGEAFAGKELRYTVNPNVNMGYLDAARKSKLYKMLTAILGAPVETVGKFGSADIMGRQVKLVIKNTSKTTEKGERVYSNISDFLKVSEKRQVTFVAKVKENNDF